MAVSIQDRKRTSSDLKGWLEDVSAYERAFKKWEERVTKILRRYRDDDRQRRQSYENAQFNVLWANVQTIVPAVYSRIPQPDVSRRFRDNDPVGRVASLMLERALDFEIQHYSDYRTALEQCVYDRFLGGRGQVWVRYEPKIGPGDDLEITEDAESEQYEQLDTECSPVDYVHWKDFGHNVCRTWSEVTRVWRRVYMTKEQLVERFGAKIAAIVPMDKMPDELKKSDAFSPRMERAAVYEGWDKTKKRVVWFSKSVKDFLDERDDPLNLEDFFPCPQPLYATITNESLVPIPDFTLYQDQANELDILSDRIDGLIKGLKIAGVYDASQGTMLARLFSEASGNELFPVKNWTAFAEKSGLSGAIDVIDLTPIANALEQSYLAFNAVKSKIDEITGIADIIRGQSAATETATAVVTKGQYASLRLKSMQNEVARFAADVIRIKAQVVCRHYSPQTIVQISGALQMQPVDIPLVPQALMLLKDKPLRNFRVEIASDTLVEIDEEADKRKRVEFLGAVGKFLTDALPVAQEEPAALPLLLELLKFGVRGFKIGKTIEGLFDQYSEQATQQAQMPKPPNPKLVQAQAQAQAAQAKAQGENVRSQADVAIAQSDTQAAQAKAAADIARAKAAVMEKIMGNVIPMRPM